MQQSWHLLFCKKQCNENLSKAYAMGFTKADMARSTILTVLLDTMTSTKSQCYII